MKNWWAWTRAALLSSVVLSGCTSPNPRSCADGNCTDPAFPYCDADGSLAGTPKSCIAVDCTPGEVAQCQGSEALTCNDLGGDYDLVHCDHGCDLAAGGCRLCEPNQTACTNGKVATCDATGHPTVKETCALGCFENEPRCREIVPSNGVAMYLDLVAKPPDLDLLDAVFDTQSGTVTDAGNPVSVPSFAVFAPQGGVPLRVFVVGKLTIKNARALTSANPYDGSPALVLLARDVVRVSGTLDVGVVGSVLSPASCVGSPGKVRDLSVFINTGGGGGAHATAGAAGGDVNGNAGGLGGQPSGSPTLVPLRGGCVSGGFKSDDTAFSQEIGTLGGGALQITSRVAIQVDGTIKFAGLDGEGDRYRQTAGYWFNGGGAGGGLLLEAPKVTLGAAARLDGRGGTGGGLCLTANASCTPGGAGATALSAAAAGASLTTSAAVQQAGSGGGGLGRIRINAPGASYTKTNSTIEDGAVTTGDVVTR